MHAQHSSVQLILAAEDTFSHKAVTDRSLNAVCQLPHFLVRAGDIRAAAHKDKGFLGLTDHLRCHFQIHGVDVLCDAADRRRTAGFIFRNESCHIFGHIHQHRSRSSAFGNIERFPNGVRQNINVLDNETVFCNRHRHAGDIDLLEGVPSQQRFSHVGRDRHQRNGIHVGSRDSCHQVCGSRS